jgi:hypothetical protein
MAGREKIRKVIKSPTNMNPDIFKGGTDIWQAEKR